MVAAREAAALWLYRLKIDYTSINLDVQENTGEVVREEARKANKVNDHGFDMYVGVSFFLKSVEA